MPAFSTDWILMMPQKCRNVTNIGGDGSSLFRHRHFGTLDISICVPYGPLDVPAHGHFISTDVPAQGHYGIGMLRHWDVFTGWYFDTCRTSPGPKATSTFQQETFWQIHMAPNVSAKMSLAEMLVPEISSSLGTSYAVQGVNSKNVYISNLFNSDS